jgi:hypothetical protein
MDTTFLDWATAYAKSLNWFVFPLAPRGKTPITPNGFKDASNDPERIRAWWTQTPQANIGVDCGRSNLAVIDLDGAHALDRWNVIVDSMGLPFARCAVAQTGGGGNHIVYAQPSPRIRNTSGKLGKGIDTRGDGGYIVLAPSIHPSGNRYEWLNEQEPEYGLDPMPDQLADLILNTPLPPAAEAKPVIVNPKGALKAAISKVAQAPKGERNNVLSNQAWFLLHLVKDGSLPLNVATDALRYAGQGAGLTEREIQATLISKTRLVLGG